MSLSVLIADGNKDHAESLALLVTAWGYDVYVCLEPEAALDFYCKFWPDVMLLDIGFPRRSDGLALVTEAKKLIRTKITTFIAITGHSDDQTRAMAKEAGFYLYLVKPVDLDQLQAILEVLHKEIE
ncbi:MAG: response regulator [Gemmatales bacterium]